MKVEYAGDGSRYVMGRPAIPGHVEDVDAETGAALIADGLYVEVKEAKPKAKPSSEADGAATGGSDA